MARRKRTAHEMAADRVPVVERDALYRKSELPGILRCGRDAVAAAIRVGELKHVFVGKTMIVRGEWILQYLENRTKGG